MLDLRGDLGGYLTAALSIASEFIASGPVYWEQPASGAPEETTATPGGVATDPSIKLVVLIDKDSASASEIVAGALQDTKRGILVGQQSYGKGTVQEFLPLDDDNGGFRLTIARWLTPNQRWIHKIGRSPPDVFMPPPRANTPAGTDPVLDKALQVLGVDGPVLVPATLGLIRGCGCLGDGSHRNFAYTLNGRGFRSRPLGYRPVMGSCPAQSSGFDASAGLRLRAERQTAFLRDSCGRELGVPARGPSVGAIPCGHGHGNPAAPPRPTSLLRHRAGSGTVLWERKEVMCSDRQYA